MEIISLKGTRLLDENLRGIYNPAIRTIVDEGGTRSSKTYSICQALITVALEFITSKTITIVRKTLPSLRTSVMRDFFEILNNLGIYDSVFHNKTENNYQLRKCMVEFMSMDQPQKKRGSKRDLLWMNETNEFTLEDYMQLSMRTSDKVIMDYNPSDESIWIYDKVLGKKDTLFIHSTYNDNPFLTETEKRNIENLKDIDEDYWRIYGLGEKGKSISQIYSNWQEIDIFPDDVDEEYYGIDFGFNNPSAVVHVGIKDGRDAYIEESLYASRLTNTMLIEELKSIIPEQKRSRILLKADSAEPDRIQEINSAGFMCEGNRKGAGSVRNGIDTVKKFRIFIVRNSPNIKKELKQYKWRVDKNGTILDEPVKFRDHGMDAMRYVLGDLTIEEDFTLSKTDVSYGKDREAVSDMVSVGDRDTANMDWN